MNPYEPIPLTEDWLLKLPNGLNIYTNYKIGIIGITRKKN